MPGTCGTRAWTRAAGRWRAPVPSSAAIFRRRACEPEADAMPLSNLAVRDIETVLHPNTNLAGFRETGPLVLERGKGACVYDSDGKAYIEGMAGLWCTALGYGNEELIEAAEAQMSGLSVAL